MILPLQKYKKKFVIYNGEDIFDKWDQFYFQNEDQKCGINFSFGNTHMFEIIDHGTFRTNFFMYLENQFLFQLA